MEILCPGLESLNEAAARAFEYGKKNKVWLLKGEMGAGKTTFVHALAAQLGTDDRVNSPSYTLINEYRGRDSRTLFHFDFFRVKTAEEALDTGFFDYIDSGNYCFIEWPELIESLIPSSYTEVNIQVTGPNSRIFKVDLHG